MKYLGAVLSAAGAGLVIALYALLYIFILSFSGLPFWITAVITLLFLVILTALIYTLIIRIREIKGGEEDDLGKY